MPFWWGASLGAVTLQSIAVCSNAAGEYENENENEDENLLFWWGASLYAVTLRASRCTCRDVASSRMNGKQRKYAK